MGKKTIVVPTGHGVSNTYIVDICIPFGEAGQKDSMYILENITVMEYQVNNPYYQGLLGRDILDRGFFSMASFDKRFTFCI